ncbi:SDR family NAD(P)-dependent oxidoreductase [Streptomyces olivaceoviridis]|uniref:SDR family NAD(P)-dependent oxidoreductase n=1 Tax=Streptomyces olivaceoviridis TaxID=1921 RepID=UPI00331D7CD6
MKRLEGKVALISGTARGQGRAAALRFAAEGALVVGGDLPHEEAAETRRLIAREGGTALSPGPLDITDKASVRSWVAGGRRRLRRRRRRLRQRRPDRFAHQPAHSALRVRGRRDRR